MTGAGVAIIGLGASGRAAARLALTKGETVYVSDIATHARATASAAELEELGACVDLGTHDLSRIQAAGVVVVSPGIPPDAAVLRELRSCGARWVSEPEFAVRFLQGSLIAITGTNGKTTTSALTAHLLGSSGVSVALGGNVGGGIAPPASELALLDPAPAWHVLEVSSFQLADTVTFSPDIGVVTNLAPDHLDRYPDTDAYFADKARLFANARSTSRWVLNGDDPEALRLPGNAAGTRFVFAWNALAEPTRSAFVENGFLTLRPTLAEGGVADHEPLVSTGELRLLGRHNVMNALAAALTARLAGAESEGIREGLRTFQPLPHRLEPVVERAGVLWVNDSKATNVAAAVGAVNSLARPLVAILGGKDKGEDLRPLAAALKGRARAAVLYGDAGGRLGKEIASAFQEAASGKGGDPVERSATIRTVHAFDEAVRIAGELARPGDAVLLAPACSSYDQFESYEARGRRFSELARGREAS